MHCNSQELTSWNKGAHAVKLSKAPVKVRVHRCAVHGLARHTAYTQMCANVMVTDTSSELCDQSQTGVVAPLSDQILWCTAARRQLWCL